MRVRVLARILALFAVGATVLTVMDPGVTLVAHAVLLWAWTAVAVRTAREQDRAVGPPCLGCGRADLGFLPDGSCARCAHPPRRPSWSAKGS